MCRLLCLSFFFLSIISLRFIQVGVCISNLFLYSLDWKLMTSQNKATNTKIPADNFKDLCHKFTCMHTQIKLETSIWYIKSQINTSIKVGEIFDTILIFFQCKIMGLIHPDLIAALWQRIMTINFLRQLKDNWGHDW